MRRIMAQNCTEQFEHWQNLSSPVCEAAYVNTPWWIAECTEDYLLIDCLVTKMREPRKLSSKNNGRVFQPTILCKRYKN